jgi:antitoxin HigA-1
MTSKSRITTDGKMLPPVHPGEILREEFMVPLGLSANRLALDLRVAVTRISEIIHERRAISADTAMRLARYFGTTPEFWMNLQTAYDLETAKRKQQADVDRDVRPLAANAKG